MALTPPNVRGVRLDSRTRCEHYRGPTDIIAIKMKCCGLYYACKDCHEMLADHPIAVWLESEWTQQAVLCGACGATLTILQYMQSDSRCPACRAQFNSRCRYHYHYYFDVSQVAERSPDLSPERGHG
jgi:uncharacterized CHY-type Zn-finger protein